MEIKIEKLVPDISEKKQYAVAMNVISAHDRITSEKGVQLRVNRSIQAEGAFALWKEDQKFRQFLCRGQANVYAESVLMAIAQNIENLHRHIQKRQLGQHLYEV